MCGWCWGSDLGQLIGNQFGTVQQSWGMVSNPATPFLGPVQYFKNRLTDGDPSLVALEVDIEVQDFLYNSILCVFLSMASVRCKLAL